MPCLDNRYKLPPLWPEQMGGGRCQAGDKSATAEAARSAAAREEASVLHSLPCLLGGRRQLIHMLEEERDGPHLLIREGGLP